nr:unnamed protein product [Callosobruchus analis]
MFLTSFAAVPSRTTSAPDYAHRRVEEGAGGEQMLRHRQNNTGLFYSTYLEKILHRVQLLEKVTEERSTEDSPPHKKDSSEQNETTFKIPRYANRSKSQKDHKLIPSTRKCYRYYTNVMTKIAIYHSSKIRQGKRRLLLSAKN